MNILNVPSATTRIPKNRPIALLRDITKVFLLRDTNVSASAGVEICLANLAKGQHFL